ncbi:unnamed protein product, partial [marine sediment metagenome]
GTDAVVYAIEELTTLTENIAIAQAEAAITNAEMIAEAMTTSRRLDPIPREEGDGEGNGRDGRRRQQAELSFAPSNDKQLSEMAISLRSIDERLAGNGGGAVFQGEASLGIV